MIIDNLCNLLNTFRTQSDLALINQHGFMLGDDLELFKHINFIRFEKRSGYRVLHRRKSSWEPFGGLVFHKIGSSLKVTFTLKAGYWT